MSLPIENYPRHNFFTEFFYDEWVAESFCANHSKNSRYDIREYVKLLSHFGELDHLEASFAICWQQVRSGFFEVDEYVNYRLATLEWVSSSERLLQHMSEGDIASLNDSVRCDIDEYVDAHSEMCSSCLELLPALVRKYRSKIQPDEYILDREAIVYIHLAVGQALLLENVEGAKSERYWELIEDALRAIRAPKTESVPPWYSKRPEIQEPIEISLLLMEAYIWANLFHRNYIQGDFGQALECLSNAAALCEEVSDENLEAFDQQGMGVIEWMARLPKDYPGILTVEIGAHFVAHIVPAQKAVEAFERVFNDDLRTTNWDRMADACTSIGNICELYKVSVSVQTPFSSFGYTEAVSYWQIAHALAQQKTSPDAIIDVMRAMQDSESESRLRLYFFPEEWKNMPDKARASLISADREYERTDGKRPIIFDHLRSASRAIMVEKFWKPFRVFLTARARAGLKDVRDLDLVTKLIEDDQSEPDLAPLLRAPHFEEFLSTLPEDPRFLRRLPEKLNDLNDWANKVSHEHHWGYKGFEGQIRETYAEFMGIGRVGILPRLMRLQLKAGH